MTAIASAVRGRQLNLCVSPCLLSYLLKGLALENRDTGLMTGVIFRDYFAQFPAVIAASPAAATLREEMYIMKK